MNILVLHPGALGDIILSLPAVALLRRHYPDARITFAANLDYLAPISGSYADCTISLSSVPLRQLYVADPLFEPDGYFWKGFDRIVSWTGSGDVHFKRNLKKIHPEAIVAPWRPEPDGQKHVSRLFIESLGLATPPEMRGMPAQISLGPENFRKGLQWLKEHGWDSGEALVALHPGAGSTVKRWPLPRFVDLAARLTGVRNGKLLLVEGPAESGLARQISGTLPEAASIVAESVPLDLLAAVLQCCRAFVGNDSGLAHLAAALNIRTVVLFGPTRPRHWAPLGEQVVVLHRPRNCRACTSGNGAHTCLQGITVEDVIRALPKIQFSR